MTNEDQVWLEVGESRAAFRVKIDDNVANDTVWVEAVNAEQGYMGQNYMAVNLVKRA